MLCILAVLLVGYESLGGRFGRVRWHNGGADPDEITVHVRGDDGRPLAGLEVVSTSYSGTSIPSQTSADGTALILPGEDEVLALEVDGKKVMDRDNPIEQWFAPTLTPGGLVFDVRLKDK